MPDWVEIPVFDSPDLPTGEILRVPLPPPVVFRRDSWAGGRHEVLELQRIEVLRRFGCGCFRDEELRYVRST